MSSTVRLKTIREQPIAAVRRNVHVDEVGNAWAPALDLVYEFLGDNPGLRTDGHNVFIYRQAVGDSKTMEVEFGVQVTRDFSGKGEVVSTATPAGEFASAVADGYAFISPAMDAILAWCSDNDRETAGTSMEIYGDPDEHDHSKIKIEVLYLLR